MDVETGINGRLANRRATEAQERARLRSFHAAGSTGRQLRQPVKPPGIVAITGTLNVNLNGTFGAERKTNWQPRATNHTSVKLRKYAQQIGSAAGGALTYRGGVFEKLRYVDV